MDTGDIVIDFNASTVPLASSNLIEASAGTGKTYSIAILVLRILLEKRYAIKEILMVTFTKAAVAELEERIRLFVRSAYQVVNGEDIDDKTICQLVDQSIEELGRKNVKEILSDAIVFLDETSVMTIHSFCQQTLTEFAFETNQLFGVEIVNDTALIIENEVNQFWRKNIPILPTELLGNLLAAGLSRTSIAEVILASLNGKEYIGYQKGKTYAFPEAAQKRAEEDLLVFTQREKEFQLELCGKVEKNRQELKDISKANSYAKKSVLPLLDHPEKFLTFIQTSNAKYIVKLYPHWIEECEKLKALQEERIQFLQAILTNLYSFAIQTIIANIEEYKRQHSILSFNDLIAKLHKALVQAKNDRLVSSLQKKYKAVFVDEFQDTDKLQYEIFQKVFNENTLLFYIGDPKQSIYAWRQADIATYFQASKEVSIRYGMNHNYRSSVRFIDAMNLFFKPNEDFDTFSFQGEGDAIRYIDVVSPEPNNKGNLYKIDHPEVPITIFENANKAEIIQSVSAQIIDLLESGAYQIDNNGKRRPIRPSDIGILVRTNTQGREIKNSLAHYGIPAITIDDNKILQAEEAQYLSYVLMAFIENNSSHIHKALLSPFTGYTRKEIATLDDEAQLERFRAYGVLWQKSGIYIAMMQFIADYSIKSILLRNKRGERTITNVFQLVEILHKVQTFKKLSDLELIHWLKRGMEGTRMEGDEFEQRVESDEEAVKIATIHKSKGLEYNLVFAPFLDLPTDFPRSTFCSFRAEDSGEYLFADKSQLNEHQKKLFQKQLEQENRRLIYVAITRAVYKCYINKNSKSTSLSAFIAELKTSGDIGQKIRFEETLDIPADYQYSGEQEWKPVALRKADRFELTEKYWRKLSYTYLAKKNAYIPKENFHLEMNEYEKFVFKQLIKGSLTGNMLHYIFENIDFERNQYWEKVVISGLKRFMPKFLESYKSMLLKLIYHTVNADISFGDQHFKLIDISKEKRLVELEFDFNVSAFNTKALDLLSESDSLLTIHYHEEIEGIMNGKIDLFFEYQGLYYILDWKSNFLGDASNHYQPDKLKEVMSNNNYHLQYLIYTLAAKKYLQQRIPGFDYEQCFGGIIYVFLRGVREGSSNGIFTYKPSLVQIQSLEKIISD